MCFYVWQRYSETRNGERDKRRHAERCKYQTAGVSREKKKKKRKEKKRKWLENDTLRLERARGWDERDRMALQEQSSKAFLDETGRDKKKRNLWKSWSKIEK
jgi:hypothetical protein